VFLCYNFIEPPDLHLVFMPMLIVQRIKKVNLAEIDMEDQEYING